MGTDRRELQGWNQWMEWADMKGRKRHTTAAEPPNQPQEWRSPEKAGGQPRREKERGVSMACGWS